MKLERCILHIGTEKTGSTSIQTFIHENRSILLRFGAYVPTCLGTPNHLGITVASAKSSRVADLRRHIPGGKEPQTAFREHIAGALASEVAMAMARGASTLLISNEHLHSRIHTLEEAQRVIELLTPHAKHIKGLIYLRRQDRLAMSLHSTRLKLDSGSSADIFPGKPSDLRYYDYLNLADLWESALGQGNLCLRQFDRTRLKGGDLLEDYLGTAGLRDEVLQECTRPKQMNESLSPEAQIFLELFNKRIPRYIDGRLNPMRGNIVSILERCFPGSRPIVARQKARSFYEKFVGGNQELAKKFGLSEPLFDDDFSMYAEDDEVESVSFEDAVEIACALWKAQRKTILRLENKSDD